MTLGRLHRLNEAMCFHFKIILFLNAMEHDWLIRAEEECTGVSNEERPESQVKNKVET